MRSDVVALFVDPRGPYPKLVEEFYDERRDARTYAGDLPVVAHPPCGPWGPMRHLCRNQDRSLAPHALAVVRRVGGVLEHPRGSMLWEEYGLPKPGELPDAYGGISVEVSQVDWGHVARKRTWLYLVGVRALGALPPARAPTHWCSGFRSSTHRTPKRYKQNGSAVPPGIKVCSAQQRRRSPVAFAEWLLQLAAGARR